MDSINVLIDYFSMFKKYEMLNNNEDKSLKKIDSILNMLNKTKDRNGSAQYFTDFNLLEDLVKKYDISDIIDEYLIEKYNIKDSIDNENNDVPNYVNDIVNNVNKGVDNVLYDAFYNAVRYNNYLNNKKVKSQDLPISTDISFDSLDVKLKDILDYLDIKDGVLDKRLINDLSKMVDLDKFKEFAIALKTDNGMRRVLFDKIEDKNVLVSILLHSDIDVIDSIINIFASEDANINKVVSNIPSIFIKDLNNSKCKFSDILTNYDNFINNYNLIKERNVNFKKMLNYPVFFINDYDTNRKLVGQLDSYENENITKNILEYVGGILVTNPILVYNNISVLKKYDISLTNDDNNNGYTLLGMHYLEKKLNYLLENNLWTKGDLINLDTIDLLRGLIIKDGYVRFRACENKDNYDKIDSTSSNSEDLDEESSLKKLA